MGFLRGKGKGNQTALQIHLLNCVVFLDFIFVMHTFIHTFVHSRSNIGEPERLLEIKYNLISSPFTSEFSLFVGFDDFSCDSEISVGKFLPEGK